MPLVGDSMASCSVTKYDEPAVYFMPWGNSKKKKLPASRRTICLSTVSRMDDPGKARSTRKQKHF
jgi:hypothetical protein